MPLNSTLALRARLLSTPRTGAAPVDPEEPDPPAGDEVVPYDYAAGWNVLIAENVDVHENSAGYITALNSVAITTQRLLSCDPTQFTIPCYIVDASTPVGKVRLTAGTSGWTYNDGDNLAVRVPAGSDATGVPIPSGFIGASAGDDAQMVFWDPDRGIEWTFWRFGPAQHTTPAGEDPETGVPNYTPPESGVEWVAQAYMQSHTKTDLDGNRYYGRCSGTSSGGTATVQPAVSGVGGRGAGTSYLAGLVRPWEIDAGVISHALAFACSCSSPAWVYPAAKSDGSGTALGGGTLIPEGTRLQILPSKTEADFDTLLNAYIYPNAAVADEYDGEPMSAGHKNTAKILMRCLQQYGMYNIDNSGSSKIYVEADATARQGDGWSPTELIREVLNPIPWSWFRAVEAPQTQF